VRMTAFSRVGATLAVALLGATQPVSAQGFALRGGASVEPIQLYGGMQYSFAPVWETLRPTPSVDFGVANGAPLIAVNIDALMHSRPLGPRSAWTVLVGGGPVINHYRLPSDSQNAVGIRAVGVLNHASGWFGEFRLGFFDGPNVRLGVGYRLASRGRSSPLRRP
jgi:hypothetical protein